MTGGAAFRGQPLLLLAGLLLAWTVMRVALWDSPIEQPLGPPRYLAATPQSGGTQPADRTDAIQPSPPIGTLPHVAPGLALWHEHEVPAPLLPPMLASFDEAGSMTGPVAAPPLRPAPRVAIGHNLLLAAGLAQMEVPPALMAYLQARGPAGPGIPAAAPALAAAGAERPAISSVSRWSGDGWLLLRNDSITPILSGRPSYGRSQVGAVIRYNLTPASGLRPQAYVRASSALAGAHEQEVAAGFSARPLPGVPLRVAAEARFGETARGTRVRPAAYAVTEFPPLALPFGARGEVYLQGGYVGGDYATAFVDGQARIERSVARLGSAEFSAGAGAWGGAEKDAARLDIGPTAAVSFRLGEAYGRVAADYRFRVAGDAEPKSGPALTVSAGF